jgi:Spy/CpxP family protein refolding chaperone
MKTNAIKGKFIPLLVTGLCLIFLAPHSIMAQDKQAKNVKTIKIETKEIRQEKSALKLTDDQKAKMKDLRVENMKVIQTLKAQSQELKAHLKTLNLAEKPDNKAIFKTIDELTANRGEIMKHMITFKQSVKAILTPEQLKAFELRRMNRHMGMGGHNQMWGQQGNRNFGRGQMMQRGGMNRPGIMRRGGQMGQGGMRPQGPMMNRPDNDSGHMMPHGQMQKRFQMMRQGRPLPSDSTKLK